MPKSFALPKRILIKKAAEIRAVLENGTKRTGKTVNIFVLPSEERKFAVLVPRRLGKAVRRNRMKRLVREIYRQHPEWFEKKTVVFFIKRFNDHYARLEKEIERMVT